MALRLLPTPAAATTPASPARELDVDSLRRAGTGDTAATRAFVSCYERRVFTLCARLLGDHGAAEDAAQETFFKALRALPRFDPTQATRPSTWLLTIATHHCLDELRRRRRRPVIVGGADDTFAISADRADAGTADRSSMQQVEHALRGLSDDHRAVFVLRILAERSVEETAAVLGVDAGTVKSRLSRARDALRAQLGDRS